MYYVRSGYVAKPTPTWNKQFTLPGNILPGDINYVTNELRKCWNGFILYMSQVIYSQLFQTSITEA